MDMARGKDYHSNGHSREQSLGGRNAKNDPSKNKKDGIASSDVRSKEAKSKTPSENDIKEEEEKTSFAIAPTVEGDVDTAKPAPTAPA